MKKIISILLAMVLLFSYTACGEYNPPADNSEETTPPKDDNNGGGNDNTEEVGEPFTATVMLNGKAYIPPAVPDDSLALKVRWSNGKNVHTVNVDSFGMAECYGLDGDYTVTLVNLSDEYTYNPNIYKVDNENRNVVIELLSLTYAKGEGVSIYKCIMLSNPGVYRANITKAGQIVYFEFTPTKSGIYSIESLVDVSAEMCDPVADVYYGSSAFKYYAYQLDGGGISQGYTTNFRHIIEVDESFIGNSYTFAVFVNGKDVTYPTYVDFEIAYKGSYNYDWIQSNLIYPSLIPNNSTYFSWYSNYTMHLASDRAKYGDSSYKIASTKIDGKNVFIWKSTNDDGTVKEYFKLNPDDGYYHVYDEEVYAAYGGWGPILYANITIPTEFVDKSLNSIEYAGNRALTVSSGTENYKLFIEGYNELIRSHGDDGPYFCLSSCDCYKGGNGGVCAQEDNCQTCAKNGCRTLPKKYIGQRGYADIAIEGRCPVTEELRDFLQKFCVSQKYFSDGNGWAEQHIPRYDAYEDSQWLFACGYYTN